MKKYQIVLGQTVHYKETGLAVEVVDLNLSGNKVGITSGCVAKIVDADVLEALPEVPPTSVEEQPVVEEVPVAHVVCVAPSTIPTITKTYDEKTDSLYLVINGKTTICISHVQPEIIDAVGISFCNDTDKYNKEIGEALAFSRAFAATNAAHEENEKRSYEDFLKFMEEKAAEQGR